MKKRNQVGTIGRVEKTSEHFMSSTGGKSIFKKPTASGASQGTSIDSKEPPFAMWESIYNKFKSSNTQYTIMGKSSNTQYRY